MMVRLGFAATLAAACFLMVQPARADRVALLSSRGDSSARTSLDLDLAQGLKSLGHTLVSAEELSAAGGAIGTRTPDGKSGYLAVARATHAEWVIVGSISPSSATSRVEITACLAASGRVEAVAREVDRADELAETREMLSVLVRADGIGQGALPWEGRPPSSTPTTPETPGAPRLAPSAIEDPPDDRAHRWSFASFSEGKRGFIGVTAGMDVPFVRPGVPASVSSGVSGGVSSGVGISGNLRGGYGLGDLGFEILGDLGGTLFGPRLVWLDAGVRWMVGPGLRRGGDGTLRGAPFFIGPEIVGGALFELATGNGPYTAPAVTRGMLGGGLDLAFALRPYFTIDARLGNLRWAPGGGGTLVFAGADIGSTVHF